MGLSGYKITQRGRLGAHRSLNVICRRVIRNFLKCYMYCMSGPSLHRESTDPLIKLISHLPQEEYKQLVEFMLPYSDGK